MSSILKALKRVEHEKTERSPEALNINADILRVTDSPRNISVRSVALLLVLFFGGGAAVAVFFLKDEPKTLQSAVRQPATVEKSNPASPPPVINYEKTPAEIVIVPAGSSPSPKKIVRQKVNTAARSNVPADDSVKNAEPLPPKQSSHVEKAPIPELPSVPVLRVNGIAFQNNSADSMAIVNGIPVATGSVIEGVTVDELKKDRVVFQRDGEKFEIRMGQSNE
ncbi:MAG: general secretion pathway protein GspB [Desulfuromonadaceae bacterium]|nr:general secretion pathway protein GspB [Desulfuromonadaceae bacterium]MDD5105815.1 general secretion pathway protein GspB [Desulfuromonadaceae bacterium]